MLEDARGCGVNTQLGTHVGRAPALRPGVSTQCRSVGGARGRVAVLAEALRRRLGSFGPCSDAAALRVYCSVSEGVNSKNSGVCKLGARCGVHVKRGVSCAIWSAIWSPIPHTSR